MVVSAGAGTEVVVLGQGCQWRVASARVLVALRRRWSQPRRKQATFLRPDSTATGLMPAWRRGARRWGSGCGHRRSRRAVLRRRSRCRAFEERQEDVTVGVRADRVADLGGEQADLSTIGLRAPTSVSTDRGARRLRVRRRGRPARRGAWRAARRDPCAAVVVAGEEPGERLLAEPVRVDGRGVTLEEREADRAIEISEDLGSAGPEPLELGAELVAQRDALLDQNLAASGQRRSALV